MRKPNNTSPLPAKPVAKPSAKAQRHNDPCSVARALNDVGDWWSLLIVRQAMYGTRRYGDFQKQLGIAKNILCDRLTRLVNNEVLKKVDIGEHGQRFEYRLTEKGKDLFPVLVALRQWGDKWNREDGDAPVRLVDRRLGQPVQRIQVLDKEGQALTVSDVLSFTAPEIATK
jgi:DNA-binding HxlR family transcriptional regulator